MKRPRPAPGLERPPVVHPAELLEDEAVLVGGDAGPVVEHRDEHVAVLRPGPHLDLVAGNRVLGGVRHEVEEELS